MRIPRKIKSWPATDRVWTEVAPIDPKILALQMRGVWQACEPIQTNSYKVVDFNRWYKRENETYLAKSICSVFMVKK